MTLPIKSTFSVITSSLAYEYVLPDTFITPYRVTHSSKSLEEKTIEGLDAESSLWMNSYGDPNSYFIRHDTQTVIGVKPIPLASSTSTLKVFFHARANTLSATTDIPFNNFRELYQYHYILAFYAAYRGWLIYGDTALAQIYYNEYVQGVQLMRSVMGDMPNFNPSIRGERGR